MKTLLLFLSLLITGFVHAANPSFGQFSTNDFTVVNGVSVKVNTNRVVVNGGKWIGGIVSNGIAIDQTTEDTVPIIKTVTGTVFEVSDPGGGFVAVQLRFYGNIYGSGSGLTNIPLTGLVNGADILTNAYAGRATVQSLTVSNSALPVTLSNNVVGVLQANGDFTAQAITSLSGSGFFGVGTSLTALNASQLTSGTVPNAALTNITRTNLNLVTGNHTNVASVNPTNNVLTVTGGLTNGTLSTATDRFGVDANGRMKGGNGGWAASGVGFTVYNLGEIGISSSGGPSYTTTSDTKLTRVSAGTFTGHTNLHMMGEVTATNGFYFPSGTGITNAWLTNNAALDFTDTAAGTRTTLTINLTNASEGDFVILSVPPNVAQHTTAVIAKYSASVTNGYINVNYDNLNLLSSQDPPAGNFRVIVQKWK